MNEPLLDDEPIKKPGQPKGSRRIRSPAEKLSKRSGNNALASWGHRCYYIRPKNHGEVHGWKATNLFPALGWNIPSEFLWTVREDKEGMCAYIDAVLTGRQSEIIFFETKGLAVDIKTAEIDRPNDIKIRANITRFVDCLMLRDSFDVPLWGKIHFVTDGHNIVPVEFIAAIAQLLDPLAKKYTDPSREWWHCHESDLTKMGLTTADVTSSMYRSRYERAGVEVDSDDGNTAAMNGVEEDSESIAPLVQPREIEISRRRFDRHFELVTLVKPERKGAYYARRLLTYRGAQLWVGTSFFPEGPWKVYHRDSATLLALGVTVDE